MKSKVKIAAVLQDGKLFTGQRHGNIILYMHKQGCPKVTQPMQGFIDEDGQFLSRADAYERAVECGQIKVDGGQRVLTSEMLY